MAADLRDGRNGFRAVNAPFCRLGDLEDPGSRGSPDGRFFVVRRGGEAFAYLNVCPHYGAPLDWRPHAFLSVDRDLILCSMHGALFDIASGICVRGPCAGQALTRVEARVEGGDVFAGRAPPCPDGRTQE